MITGIVEATGTKDVTTKFGVKPTYSLKVNGSWYKSGFKNPKADSGDEVQFEESEGTYGKEAKDVKVVSKGSGVAPTSTASSRPTEVPKAPFVPYNQKVFPIPPLHGDRSIIRQNALARSVELQIASYGGKPFATDEKSLSEMLIAQARKFEAYTAGDLDLEAATKESAVELKEAA